MRKCEIHNIMLAQINTIIVLSTDYCYIFAILFVIYKNRNQNWLKCILADMHTRLVQLRICLIRYYAKSRCHAIRHRPHGECGNLLSYTDKFSQFYNQTVVQYIFLEISKKITSCQWNYLKFMWQFNSVQSRCSDGLLNFSLTLGSTNGYPAAHYYVTLGNK